MCGPYVLGRLSSKQSQGTLLLSQGKFQLSSDVTENFFSFTSCTAVCWKWYSPLQKKVKCSLRAVQLHSFQGMDPMFGAPGRTLRHITLNSQWQILGRVTEGTRMWFNPVQAMFSLYTEWVNKVADMWIFQMKEDPSSFQHWHTFAPHIFERMLSSMHRILLEVLKKGRDTWEKMMGLGDWRTCISGWAPPLPGWVYVGVTPPQQREWWYLMCDLV